jgi:hypothetical protein
MFVGVGQAYGDAGDLAGGFLEVRGEAAGGLGGGRERLLVGCLEEPGQGRQEAVHVVDDLVGQVGGGALGRGGGLRFSHGAQVVTEPVAGAGIVGRGGGLGVEVDAVSGQGEHLRRVRGLLVLSAVALVPLQVVVPGVEVPLDDESGALQQGVGEAVATPGFEASSPKAGDTDIRLGQYVSFAQGWCRRKVSAVAATLPIGASTSAAV